MDAVHVDVVEVWNLKDGTRCLSSTEFKENMYHIVDDLAAPARAVPMRSRSKFPEWVDDVYDRWSPENVQCLMGYIVDLNVILNDICRTTGGIVSADYARQAMDSHVRSGRKDEIHRDISRFVTEAFANKTSVLQGDVVLEKMVELIRQYCAPLSPTVNG